MASISSGGCCVVTAVRRISNSARPILVSSGHGGSLTWRCGILGAQGGRFMRPRVRCVFSKDSGSQMTDVPPSQTTRWRAVVRVLRSPMDSLSCALLPASCALCGYPLPQLSSAPICDVCWTEFPAQSGPVCARCGDALNAPAGPSFSPLCRVCRLAPPPFTQAVAYGAYQGRMKEAIHALKYDRLHPAARGLGRLLAEAIAKLAGQAPAEMLVVPIPLHRAKYAERGFNQARSLAREALGFLCARAIPSGGSRWPRARSCGCAPRKARPGSRPASAG